MIETQLSELAAATESRIAAVTTAEELEAMTKERDSLRSRLNAARARVDALLERLPESGSGTQAGNPA